LHRDTFGIYGLGFSTLKSLATTDEKLSRELSEIKEVWY
jgi:hypothetical protein